MRWPLVEEINVGGRCPTYLYRYVLLGKKWCSIYLHHFVGDDPSLDLHDHPKRFWSIGLLGGYTETYRSSDSRERTRVWRAPWIRSFAAEHAHRTMIAPFRHCWTLVIVFRATRAWGFWNAGAWIPWREYVFGKFSHLADARVSCRED